MGEHFLYLPSAGYCLLVGSQLPGDPARVDAKERRGLAIVAGLVLVVCLVRTRMFASFERESSRTIDAAAQALRDHPEARLLLVADLPVAAALAFPHAVRLALPGRDVDVEILSLLSHITYPDYSVVHFDPPSRLTLRRATGFFGSYIERALGGPHMSFQPGQKLERAGYDVVIQGESDGRVDAFEVTMADPAHALVLLDTPYGFERLPRGPTP